MKAWKLGFVFVVALLAFMGRAHAELVTITTKGYEVQTIFSSSRGCMQSTISIVARNLGVSRDDTDPPTAWLVSVADVTINTVNVCKGGIQVSDIVGSVILNPDGFNVVNDACGRRVELNFENMSAIDRMKNNAVVLIAAKKLTFTPMKRGTFVDFQSKEAPSTDVPAKAFGMLSVGGKKLFVLFRPATISWVNVTSQSDPNVP